MPREIQDSSLSISIVYDAAEIIIERNLVESLSELSKDLPLLKDQQKNLIVKFLVEDHEFDIGRVENCLFNMIGMFNEPRDLSSNKKEEYFKLARALVQNLQIEYDKICQIRSDFLDTDCDEWLSIDNKRREIKKNLILARKNAASDIFERMNSQGTMGTIIDELKNDGLIYIDLHGLFINEAKERVKEFILPILPVLIKISIITGRGKHSQSGEPF